MANWIDKNVKHETLKSFLKAVKNNDHYTISPTHIRSTICKNVSVEGVTVSVYYHHYFAISSLIECRDNRDLKYNSICLSYSDADNFYNFLKASMPDDITAEVWSNNGSNWSLSRDISHETVMFNSRVVDPKKGYPVYNGYKCKCEKTYSVSEGNRFGLASNVNEEDLNSVEFKVIA
jgi:hypothetical protein